jgi:hypothetical protein
MVKLQLLTFKIDSANHTQIRIGIHWDLKIIS